MINLRIIAVFLIFFSVLFGQHHRARGHDARTRVDWQDIIVNEKPGKKITGDTVFKDEHGKTITIGSYIDRPTLILPIYYYCKQSCAIMLGNLAAALAELNGPPDRPPELPREEIAATLAARRSGLWLVVERLADRLE